MLTPEYLLMISEGGEDIAEYLHGYTIQKIIDRIIARLDHGDDYRLTATDKWQIEVLQEAGYLLEDIQKEIANKSGLMLTEIQEAMEDAGVKAMEYDDSIYHAAGLSPKPLEQSPHLIRLMQSTYEATAGDWKNFTGTFADAAQQIFIRACDEAYMKVASGTVSYSQALVEAVEAVARDGVEVTYTKYDPETGAVKSVHTDTIETATLRCIRTGVSQATGRIQMARLEEMDWDTILTSAHVGARPGDGGPNGTNHIWWQGRFFSRSGKDKRYPPFVESTGYGTVTGLCGANCRHSFGPGDGVHNPFDTKDVSFADQNEAYEIQQRQRTLERRIRKTKRECMGLQEAVSKAKAPEAVEKLTRTYERKAALLAKQNAAYNDYCDQHDLKRLSERLTIAKWDRSQAAKARAAAKRYANGK